MTDRHRDPELSDLELRAAAELVGSAADVTLVAHVQPDADALGSALALGLALSRRGGTVWVTFGEPAQTSLPSFAAEDVLDALRTALHRAPRT